MLRTEHTLNDELRAKVAHFCNVGVEAVIQSQDLPSIYEVPVNMQHQGLDAICLKKMGIEPAPAPELSANMTYRMPTKASSKALPMQALTTATR